MIVGGQILFLAPGCGLLTKSAMSDFAKPPLFSGSTPRFQ